MTGGKRQELDQGTCVTSKKARAEPEGRPGG